MIVLILCRDCSLKGDIYEFGVFKGTGLIKWATFRMASNEKFNRKIFAFDTFGKFPKSTYPNDKKFLNEFIRRSHSII